MISRFETLRRDITSGRVHLDACWVDRSTSLASGLQPTLLDYPANHTRGNMAPGGMICPL